MRSRSAAPSCIASLFLLACLFAVPAHATKHTVTMTPMSFVPANLTVATGDSVVFRNTTTGPHTVTSGAPCTSDGQYNSGNMNAGTEFLHVFASQGSFDYFCAYHCSFGMTGNVLVEDAPTSAVPGIPVASLAQNFPNPFNPNTTIAYTLTGRAQVAISIFSTNGALVARLEQGTRGAGTHEVAWNGRDASGRLVGSGVYFYRLDGVAGVAPKKMVLLK